MLFLDLLPRKDFKRTWFPSTVALVGVVFAAYFFFRAPAKVETVADFGPKIEEQQVIVAALDRLHARFPQFNTQILELEETLLRNPGIAEIEVSPSAGSEVAVKNRRLVFGQNFFKADAAFQERTLLDVIVSLHPDLNAAAQLARAKPFHSIGEISE